MKTDQTYAVHIIDVLSNDYLSVSAADPEFMKLGGNLKDLFRFEGSFLRPISSGHLRYDD